MLTVLMEDKSLAQTTLHSTLATPSSVVQATPSGVVVTLYVYNNGANIRDINAFLAL